MSLFLGKIHYWLYDKIVLHERLIGAITALAEGKGYSCESLLAEAAEQFGAPATGILEDDINPSNIHGSLQERIFSVEKRLAFIVTELLRMEIVTIGELEKVFYQNGMESMKNQSVQGERPQDLFTQIFDHMLEGMPCDNVNRLMESTDDTIIWETSRCLHKSHWDEIGGEITNFYKLRESWIKGFLDASGTVWNYSRTGDGINTIRKG